MNIALEHSATIPYYICIETNNAEGYKMKTIYVLTAWNPNKHGCNIVPFKSMKALSKYVDELAAKGFTEFLKEKRRVTK